MSGYYKGIQKLSVTAAAKALEAEGRLAERAEYLQARLPPAAPAARAPARDAKPIGCVRQYTKHYTDRPSPPYPASACIGSVKVGNDGQLYTSKRVADGMQGRWMLNKDYNLQEKELNADLDFGVAYVKFTLKNERTQRSRLPTLQELQYVVQREVLPMLLNGFGITASIDSYNFHGETGLVAIRIDKKNFPVSERLFKSAIESVDDDGNYGISDGQGGMWMWQATVAELQGQNIYNHVPIPDRKNGYYNGMILKFTLQDTMKRSRLPDMNELKDVLQQLIAIARSKYAIDISVDTYRYHDETGLVVISVDKYQDKESYESDLYDAVYYINDDTDGNFRPTRGARGTWDWKIDIRKTI